LTSAKAVILILKHVTFLRLSTKPESALSQAGLDYQKANINSTIEQFLKASSGHSVEQLSGFIMIIDIGLFILSIITIIFHETFRLISVFYQNTSG